MKPVWSAGVVVLSFLAGCNRGIESKEAVRQGIIDHLSSRSGLDVKSMQIDVTSVSFRKDEADAVVSFRPKGAPSGNAGMQMNYTLERKGNRWVVKGRRDSGMSPHGGMGNPPAGMMPPQGGMPPSVAPNAAMPPNHPPMQRGQAPSGKEK